MQSWGASALALGFAVAGFAVISGVAGCSAASAGSAELYLTVVGDGSVTTTRSTDDPGCDSGVCGYSAGDGGFLAESYTPGTNVILVAHPASGWRFVSWQITASEGSQPSTRTTSTSVGVVVEHTGSGLTVLATFAADASAMARLAR